MTVVCIFLHNKQGLIEVHQKEYTKYTHPPSPNSHFRDGKMVKPNQYFVLKHYLSVSRYIVHKLKNKLFSVAFYIQTGILKETSESTSTVDFQMKQIY